jgi:glutamate/tyrosine decarboxylase-like PLP-dependent enzyme
VTLRVCVGVDRIDLLEQELERCRAARVLVLAVVGVAGTTETGAVDDLQVRRALGF